MEELDEKVLNAISSDFIGDVVFNKEEIEEIKEECLNMYRRNQQIYIKNFSDLEICKLIVLIINLAKTWDDETEGRFWIKMFDEIGKIN